MDIQATRQNNNYHQYAVSKGAETPRSLWAPFVVQRLHLTWQKEVHKKTRTECAYC